MPKLPSSNFIPIIVTICSVIAEPTLAQKYTFSNFSLAAGFNPTAAIVIGYTSGAYSLAAIINRDKYGNPCMGYGDPEPDHTMILENDFSQLILQVDSGGKDTTLVVKGPHNEIRCGFGQNNQKDASIQDLNWKAGQYEIWVGSIIPNQRASYRLSVQQ